MIVYEIIMAVTVKIVSYTHSFLDKRKWNMFEKHSLKILNLGENIELHKPEPLHSISRSFNMIKKGENEISMENLGTSSELNLTDSINKSRAKKKWGEDSSVLINCLCIHKVYDIDIIQICSPALQPLLKRSSCLHLQYGGPWVNSSPCSLSSQSACTFNMGILILNMQLLDRWQPMYYSALFPPGKLMVPKTKKLMGPFLPS